MLRRIHQGERHPPRRGLNRRRPSTRGMWIVSSTSLAANWKMIVEESVKSVGLKLLSYRKYTNESNH